MLASAALQEQRPSSWRFVGFQAGRQAAFKVSVDFRQAGRQADTLISEFGS
jgi:hypothetical protein